MQAAEKSSASRHWLIHNLTALVTRLFTPQMVIEHAHGSAVVLEGGVAVASESERPLLAAVRLVGDKQVVTHCYECQEDNEPSDVITGAGASAVERVAFE